MRVRLTQPRTAQEFFGLRYNHVAGLHYRKAGCGPGVIFRLRDGRVPEIQARSRNTDPPWQDKTVH